MKLKKFINTFLTDYIDDDNAFQLIPNNFMSSNNLYWNWLDISDVIALLNVDNCKYYYDDVITEKSNYKALMMYYNDIVIPWKEKQLLEQLIKNDIKPIKKSKI